MQGAGEPVVADEPGRGDPLLTAGAGDRAGASVIPPGPAVGAAARVIAGLCGHPGAGDRSQARPGHDDLSVRVPAKMVPHLLFQDLDLLVQGAGHRDERPDADRAGRRQGLGLTQLLAARRRQDRGRPPGDVPAPGTLEGSADLRPGQPRCTRRLGCPAGQLQNPGCDLRKRLQAQAERVLTCRRPPGTKSAVQATRQSLLG